MGTQIPPWKTIQLGNFPLDALRTALSDADFGIGKWGGNILEKVTVATEPTEIKLVRATVAELGFPNGATRAQIYEKAHSFGLEFCPAEVGPQLRLQYSVQPEGEQLLIAMESIEGFNNDKALDIIFNVAQVDGNPYLYGFSGKLNYFWPSSSNWVFCCK